MVGTHAWVEVLQTLSIAHAAEVSQPASHSPLAAQYSYCGQLPVVHANTHVDSPRNSLRT